MRLALYVRVPTHDQQTLPLQLEVLREYAERRDCQVVREVSEVAFGAATRRPKREELLKAAKRREVDAVLVRRLDCWGRSVFDANLSVPKNCFGLLDI